MAIETKKLKNAPNWIKNIGRFGNVEDAAKIVDEIQGKNKALNVDEIDEMVDDVRVGTNEIRELSETGVLGEYGGMYYIEDDEKAKELLKLSDR